MSKANPYTPARQILMQLSMWMVLGASVAVAALVNHRRAKAFLPKLDHPTVVNGLSVRLPEGWKVEPGDAATPDVLLICRETVNAGAAGRVLAVHRTRLPGMLSPTEYLGYLLRAETTGDHAGVLEGTHYERAMLGLTPGVLLTAVLSIGQMPEFSGEDLEGLPARHLTVAAGVLPTREAVSIRLQSWGQNVDADQILVKEIAETVKVDGADQWSDAGSQIELAGGVKLRPPADFILMPERDPLRASRCMVRENLPAAWISAEVTPAYRLSNTPDFELRTMLTLRDPRWRSANVRKVDDSTWLATPADDAQFPSRAYLHTSSNGDSVLTLFQTSGGDARDVDRAWESLVSSMEFPSESDLAKRLIAGTAAAKKLRGTGLAYAVGRGREETWWLWYEESTDAHLAWTRLGFDHPSLWKASRETRVQLGIGSVMRIEQTWEGSPDLESYTALTNRTERSQLLQHAPGQRLAVIGEKGALEFRLFGLAPGKQLTTTLPTPGEFLPGGWLPWILGKVDDKKMILLTDSLVLDDVPPVGAVIPLIITPETRFPRTADTQPEPMRCLNIRINGSSDASLYYFRETGELESIVQAGGYRCTRTDPQSLKFDFPKDSLMQP